MDGLLYALYSGESSGLDTDNWISEVRRIGGGLVSVGLRCERFTDSRSYQMLGIEFLSFSLPMRHPHGDRLCANFMLGLAVHAVPMCCSPLWEDALGFVFPQLLISSQVPDGHPSGMQRQINVSWRTRGTHKLAFYHITLDVTFVYCCCRKSFKANCTR